MTPQIFGDRSTLESALLNLGCKIHGNSTTCPWHEDRNPSAGIICGDDGVWRINCLVCQKRGNLADIQSLATGKDSGDVFRELMGPVSIPRHNSTLKVASPQVEKKVLQLASKEECAAYAARSGQVESWHRYGSNNDPVLVVARIIKPDGKKTFRQFCPYKSGWAAENTIPKGQIPLYRVEQLGAGEILIVEGEKKADACWKIGVQAVTSAMGGGNASNSDWSSLRGRKVAIWPDNDEMGSKYADEVTKTLSDFGCTVTRIDPEEMGMPKKADVYDFITAHDGKPDEQIADEIRSIIGAYTKDELDDVLALAHDMETGAHRAIEWPSLPLVGMMSKALKPGTITTFCADPGAGKSFLMVQMIGEWNSIGVPASVLMLEDSRATHLVRSVAQIDENSNLVDDEYVRNNPGALKQAIERNRLKLQSVAAHITASNETQYSLDDVAAWCEKRLQVGDRVLAIDPITSASAEEKPWIADLSFIMRVKKLAVKHGASVIFVTHPRGVKKQAPDLSSMAGGSAYPRFSHSALWLSKHEMEESNVMGGATVRGNRTLHIIKSRNGRGGGLSLSMFFDPRTLRLQELGVIETKKEPVKSSNERATTKERKTRTASAPNKTEDVF